MPSPHYSSLSTIGLMTTLLPTTYTTTLPKYLKRRLRINLCTNTSTSLALLLPRLKIIWNPHTVSGHNITEIIILHLLTQPKCLNQILQPVKSLFHIARE
ncbi:hypothetical protein Hanom_Chr12g01158951 [Helianthus anomalus]